MYVSASPVAVPAGEPSALSMPELHPAVPADLGVGDIIVGRHSSRFYRVHEVRTVTTTVGREEVREYECVPLGGRSRRTVFPGSMSDSVWVWRTGHPSGLGRRRNMYRARVGEVYQRLNGQLVYVLRIPSLSRPTYEWATVRNTPWVATSAPWMPMVPRLIPRVLLRPPLRPRLR